LLDRARECHADGDDLDTTRGKVRQHNRDHGWPPLSEAEADRIACIPFGANGTKRRRTKVEIIGDPARKPAALPVNPDGIPAELRERQQWVVWRWEWRGDKAGKGQWTKVPCVAGQATEGGIRQAKTNEPRTWSEFAQALAAYGQGGWDGIGYVFSRDDPYCGVDLDACRDPDTGAMDPWAGELLALLDGYAEVSPTGTGVKVIVRATKPGKRCKTAYAGGEVEMYDRGRYFTLTGTPV
jgi:hypothetical protein